MNKTKIFFEKVGDKNGSQTIACCASVVKTLGDENYMIFSNCMLPCNVSEYESFNTAVLYYRK